MTDRYAVKDSGNHETYASGMRREPEGDKPRFDLLWPEGVPFEEQYLTRIAMHMARGAQKYAPRNWERGWSPEAYERARSSAHRHFEQWFNGLNDGEDHAAATFFNMMQVLYLEYMRDHTEPVELEPAHFTCYKCGGADANVIDRGHAGLYDGSVLRYVHRYGQCP